MQDLTVPRRGGIVVLFFYTKKKGKTMQENRDCTLVRSIPKSIADALDDATTIEQLVRDNCLKPAEENEAVNERISELRMNLFRSSINSHVSHQVGIPLNDDLSKTTVKVGVVLIDHKLIFPFCLN